MNNLTKKIVAIVTALTISLGMTGPAFGQTVADLLAQIVALQAQLVTLQTQLAALQGGDQPSAGTIAACVGITFDRNLSQGMSGNDVKCLQALLNTNAATKVADSGAGSPGNETIYFGPLTKAASIKFQELYIAEVLTPIGLTMGTGFVGTMTRTKLNAILTAGGGDGPVGPVPTASVVSLAADTPGASQVALNAQDVIFTKLKFTAGSTGYTVTKIVVTRSGVSADADISSIKLFDGVTQIGSTQALNTTTHKATISSLSWNVPANSTVYLTIKGSVAAALTATVGDSVKLGIAAATDITTTDTLQGTFPMYGNARTIAGISVGNFSVEVQTTPAATTILSGATDQEIACWAFRASNTEGFDVHSIKVSHVGTAARDDITNLKIKVIGAQIGSTITSLDVSNAATFDLSSSPLSVIAGGSKTVCAYADVASGIWTARTIIFEITQYTGVTAYGANSGGATTILQQGTTFARQTGAIMTIGQGALTVAIDASMNPASQTYVRGTSNRLITAIKFSAGSVEGVRITKLLFTLAAGTGGTCAATDISNVTLWDGTTQIAGPSSAIGNYVTFGANTIGWDTSSLFDIDATKTKTILVKADVPSGATAADTCRLSIAAATDVYADGLSSQYDLAWGAAGISGTATGNAHTIGNKGTLTVSLSSNSPVAQTYVIGGTGKEFTRINLTAGSGEDVVVAGIVLDMIAARGAASSTARFSNVKLVKEDGSQYSTTQASPLASASFSGSLTVSAGSTIVLKAIADIPTSNYPHANGSISLASTTAINTAISATGVSSAATLSSTDSSLTGTAIGNTMTIGQGGLTLTVAPSPADQTIITGATELSLVGLTMTAGTAENIRVTRVRVTMSTSGSSASTSDLAYLALWDGATRLTTKKNLTAGTWPHHYVDFSASEFLNSSGIDISKGQQKTIMVKGDIPATAVATNKFAIGVSTTDHITFVGLASNTTGVPTLSPTAGVNYVSPGTTALYETTIAAGGILTIETAADTPVEGIQTVSLAGIGAQNVAVLKLNVKSTLEAINVKSITVDNMGYATTSNPADFALVTLWDGSTQIGSAQTMTNTASTTFNFPSDGYWNIPSGSVRTLTVKVNLNGIRDPYTTGAVTGDQVLVCLDNMTAEGANSGQSPTGAGDFANCGARQTIRLSKPTIALTTPTSGTFGAGTQELIRWTVSADAKGDIGWKITTFDVSGSVIITSAGASHTVGYSPTRLTDGIYIATTTTAGGDIERQLIASSTMKVYDVDTNTEITNASLFVDQSTVGIAKVNFEATSEQIVAAGTTKTYKLVGDIAYGGQTGSAIMTKITDRSTATSTEPFNYANASNTSATFVWTDRSGGSNATHSALSEDWTNDWKVSGIPTAAKTLSK